MTLAGPPSAPGKVHDRRERIASPLEIPRKPFPLVRVGDMELKEPEYLVKGLIETDSLALVFGPPGSGKSFLALAVAASVATGTDFFGRKTLQGPVIYLAGEGHNGWVRRSVAWEKASGVSLKRAPLFISEAATGLSEGDTAKAVQASVDDVAAEVGPPRLIVIDTLARFFGDADENATKDMNRFVACLDSLRGRYPDCTILIVHHSGQGATQRARGANALKAALDAEYRIGLVGKTMTVTATKMKDADLPDPFSLSLRSIEVGIDATGKPFTSAALYWSGQASISKEGVSPTATVGLECLHDLIEAEDESSDTSVGLSVDAWRQAFYAKYADKDQNTKTTYFNRARKGLIDAGLVVVENSLVRLVHRQDQMK